MPKFILAKSYEKQLSRIESYIYETTESIDSVNNFLNLHDQALLLLEQNPKIAATHPMTGDQSWPFGNGRYRLFFKYVFDGSELHIYLTSVIDNKELNQSVYPNNSITTYDEE